MNLYSVSDSFFIVIRPATAFSPFQQPLHKSIAIRFEIEQEIDFPKLFLESLCDLQLPGRAIDQILLKNKKQLPGNYLLVCGFQRLDQHFDCQFGRHYLPFVYVFFQDLTVWSLSKIYLRYRSISLRINSPTEMWQ